MKYMTKKLVAVALSLAMVVSSIAFYNTEVEADPISLTVTSALESSDSHQLHVTWTNPSEVVSGQGFTFGYYVNSIGQDNQAKAANGWVWSKDNPTEIRTMIDTVSGTSGGLSFRDGGDFTIIVVIYLNGDVYAQGTSNSVHINPDQTENYDAHFKLDRYEPHQDAPTNTVVSWQTITGAKSYKLINQDTDEVFVTVGENATWTQWNAPTSTILNDTYTCQIIAYDSNNQPINITRDEVILNYDLETPPSEHTSADYSQATWDSLEKKGSDASTVAEDYYIDSNNGLNTFFWGIYAPDEAIPYHEQRDRCIIDTPVFTFQWSDINSVWINSHKYHNYTKTLNNQGDCGEISIEVFQPGINVVTLVMNNGDLKTFGIKVEGDNVHSIRIDGTKVADVFDGKQYVFPTSGMTEFSQYGYYQTNDNTKVYAPDDGVIVNDDLSFTGIDTLSVSNTNGATIHMVKNEPGIAFKSTITMNGGTPIFNSSFKYGTIITTQDLFFDSYDQELLLDDTRNQVHVNLNNSSQMSNNSYIIGVLNIKQANFTRDFVARAYCKINYTSGHSKVFYATNPTDSTNRVRNVSQVARSMKDATSYYNSLEESEKEAVDYFATFQ